jgi:hypothetical protein
MRVIVDMQNKEIPPYEAEFLGLSHGCSRCDDDSAYCAVIKRDEPWKLLELIHVSWLKPVTRRRFISEVGE